MCHFTIFGHVRLVLRPGAPFRNLHEPLWTEGALGVYVHSLALTAPHVNG